MKAKLIFTIAIVVGLIFQQSLKAILPTPQNIAPLKTNILLDVLIQNGLNPKATILNAKDELMPGYKLVYPGQTVAFMFQPNNPNEPVVIIDVKKAILKLVLQNPALSKNSKITVQDFIKAGIPEEEVQGLFLEPISIPEMAFLGEILEDIIEGDISSSGRYCLNGCWEIVKGTSKIGVGFSILLKKALVTLYWFAHTCYKEAYNLCKDA